MYEAIKTKSETTDSKPIGTNKEFSIVWLVPRYPHTKIKLDPKALPEDPAKVDNKPGLKKPLPISGGSTFEVSEVDTPSDKLMAK